MSIVLSNSTCHQALVSLLVFVTEPLLIFPFKSLSTARFDEPLSDEVELCFVDLLIACFEDCALKFKKLMHSKQIIKNGFYS